MILTLALLLATDVPSCPSGEDRPDVNGLVQRTEKLLQGESSIATMTMSIKTPAWSRKLKMKVWSRGKDYALIRIVEGGPRETGMMTLKRERQLWNYLPQAGRVMKLPSGMMGDSWMGSDFTNDDLVKGSSITDDFVAEVAASPEAWKVTLTPKPEAVVVWGRVEMVIDRKTCLPQEERFFDEDGKLARSMRFGGFRQLGWRSFPAEMTVIPAPGENGGRQTSITYEEIQFDVDIPEDTFGLHRLRQGR